MSIRIRTINGTPIAICAARSEPKHGDIYLDDAAHHALSEKFGRDFTEEGFAIFPSNPDSEALVEIEESNNPSREWWDRTYGAHAN